ncbi:hypothetical protein K227x_24740 [Rubripirellula lacrimiformis]|uniref:Uncharacterized protein n=1 Tax=Rubripirellula lacrimiformis TaxID=1930273 RepID=A0A517NAC0_9BACT|nr:DUF6655 family protein [Rubripirellula lacrimiformis]QDT04086.1 hypothetical protein K227x_24740 [Rubripirellula lacrimiformis]
MKSNHPTAMPRHLRNNTPRKRPLAALTLIAIAASTITASGCATTKTSNTARTASEQVLISSAIDRAMSNVQFEDFAGYKIFIEEKYLDSVDKGYLVGSLRHRILKAGGSIAASADAADLVLEARSGGVGTDSQESFVGIPSLGIPGMPIELPEIKFASRNTQMGTAKLGLVCYDPKTGKAMGLGGESTALTHNNDTYVLGVGPFRSGTVLDQREKAVGFNGTGGSFMNNPARIARAKPVNMVNRPLDAANIDSTPQIATLPDGYSTAR